jgi:pyruvate/2-oxoglutarate dehydrogenase complex dihydrolipoamide dehydrogenase (E3) component
VEVGEQVVIIGGELVACETADFLSQRGHKVTVVRRGPEMASRMFPSNRHALLSRLGEKGVVLVPNVREYEGVTDEGLVIVDGQGTRQTLQADTIVLAAGAVPDERLAKAVANRVSEVHLAGDCVEPRRILDAIHEGARVGREV